MQRLQNVDAANLSSTARKCAGWFTVGLLLVSVGCGNPAMDAGTTSSTPLPSTSAAGSAAVAGGGAVTTATGAGATATTPVTSATSGAATTPAGAVPVGAQPTAAVPVTTPGAASAVPGAAAVPAATTPAATTPAAGVTAPTTTSEMAATAWPSDCDANYSWRAHGAQKTMDTSKYTVPAESQYYESFFFKAPWGTQDVQGLTFKAVIDNPKIVHHWILYGVDDGGGTADGSMQGGPTQLLPSSLSGEAFIVGWAPGAQDTVMPDGVGLHLPTGANAMFRLEIHYNNATGTGMEADGSGLDFCTTTKKRPQEAATHWLGTASISLPPHQMTDVVSTCAPNVTAGPVHLMSMSPHMHQTGVHAKAILTRAGGAPQTLIDGPFAFSEQRAVSLAPADGSSKDLLMNAGDTITTTCTFDNETAAPISFGEDTQDEMCFFFTLAWPRGQLSNGQFSIIPGAEATVNCLQ